MKSSQTIKGPEEKRNDAESRGEAEGNPVLYILREVENNVDALKNMFKTANKIYLRD